MPRPRTPTLRVRMTLPHFSARLGRFNLMVWEREWFLYASGRGVCAFVGSWGPQIRSRCPSPFFFARADNGPQDPFPRHRRCKSRWRAVPVISHPQQDLDPSASIHMAASLRHRPHRSRRRHQGNARMGPACLPGMLHGVAQKPMSLLYAVMRSNTGRSHPNRRPCSSCWRAMLSISPRP